MIQFDSDSINSRIITRLKGKTSWADVLFFSTNQRLIDIFSEELAYDMQMNDILATECKWTLAQQISSLMSETQFFNYYPYRKVGATGPLKISTSKTFNATYALNITVPKYSIFSSTSGLNFCAVTTTNLLSTDQYSTPSIIQGTPKSITFTAKGNLYETFTVSNDSIENSVFDVYVNGELWDNVTSIREADSGASKVYVIENNYDFSGITIIFGNDSYGKKLSAGDTVVFKYIETAGLSGNIESSNIITTVTSTLYDTNGNAVTVYCTNDENITGGLDYEDIESIRSKAPRTYQTGDRAISKSDYKSILESFSFIKKAAVWGETEVNADNGNIPGTFIASEENVVHCSVVTTSDGDISTTQEATIRSSLNEKKAPADIVVFSKANFIFITFTTNAYVSNKKYPLSMVSNNILNTLKDNYSITAVDFKKIIRYSDYTSAIDSTEGVDYHETSISFYKFESFTSAYVGEININMSNIKTSSVLIQAKLTSSDSPYVQIAHDNGSGIFVAESGYTIGSSAFNYTTGVGSFIVTSGLTSAYSLYTIKIVFQTTVTDIIPTKRYQIISYGNSIINSSYI